MMLMEKIISLLMLLLVGCEYTLENKTAFQRYVDYSGMMIENTNTIFFPDSQNVLDLGAVCIASDRKKYSNNHKEIIYFKNPCFHGTELFRNYLDSVPSQIKTIWVDSLILNTNEIRCVPSWLLKKNIKYLDLSSNKIQDVIMPSECMVETIDLRENPLVELPKGIFKCSRLKVLYLDKKLKKYNVKTDTIVVHGKKLIFGDGWGDFCIDELYELRHDSHFPKAVYLDEW